MIKPLFPSIPSGGSFAYLSSDNFEIIDSALRGETYQDQRIQLAVQHTQLPKEVEEAVAQLSSEDLEKLEKICDLWTDKSGSVLVRPHQFKIGLHDYWKTCLPDPKFLPLVNHMYGRARNILAGFAQSKREILSPLNQWEYDPEGPVAHFSFATRYYDKQEIGEYDIHADGQKRVAVHYGALPLPEDKKVPEPIGTIFYPMEAIQAGDDYVAFARRALDKRASVHSYALQPGDVAFFNGGFDFPSNPTESEFLTMGQLHRAPILNDAFPARAGQPRNPAASRLMLVFIPL